MNYGFGYDIFGNKNVVKCDPKISSEKAQWTMGKEQRQVARSVNCHSNRMPWTALSLY